MLTREEVKELLVILQNALLAMDKDDDRMCEHCHRLYDSFKGYVCYCQCDD